MTYSGSSRKEEAALQVDEFAHQPIEARREELGRCAKSYAHPTQTRDRLTTLHENLQQLSLPSQNLLEEICSELRTAIEELQVAQSALCQPNEELIFKVEERLDTSDCQQALSAQGESEERLGSDVFTSGAICQGACKTLHNRTAQLRNAFEQLNREIAQRQWIEKELNQSLSMLRGTLEATADGILVSQNSRNIAAFNQKFVEIWGIPESIIASRDLNQVLPLILEQLKDPEVFLGQTQDLWSQADAEGYGTYELKDGRIFERYSLPQWIGGNIVGRVCSFREITERKRAEEELRQSEARCREVATREALINRLASLICNSLDLDTILEFAVQEIYNQLEIDACLFAWYRTDSTPCGWEVVKEVKNPDLPSYLGLYPLESWRPFTCKLVNVEVFQVDNVTEIACEEQQMLLPFGTTALLSLPIVTPSGDLGAMTCGRLVSKRSWTDEELELLQAVANQLVIGINQAQLYSQSCIAAATAQTKATQLELALSELQQTQAQLVQTEKMSSLGQLVAGVAHEINNPLNFIHGNLIHIDQYGLDLLNLIQLYQEYYPRPSPEIQAETEAIDLDFIKEDLPKILSSMKMGAECIRNIVLSLRIFSRLDEVEMTCVDIHEGLDNTLLILAHRLKAQPNHPAIEVIKEYGNLPKVECYAGQVNQVFMNILTNAIDALDEYNQQRSPVEIQNNPSTIRIRTEVNDANQVLIRIIDNGSGMTEEVRCRLFDPFFTTKPMGQGTGLGMSISYQIVVEKHGGQLRCISAPGQGTEFLIYLPIQQPSLSS